MIYLYAAQITLLSRTVFSFMLQISIFDLRKPVDVAQMHNIICTLGEQITFWD